MLTLIFTFTYKEIIRDRLKENSEEKDQSFVIFVLFGTIFLFPVLYGFASYLSSCHSDKVNFLVNHVTPAYPGVQEGSLPLPSGRGTGPDCCLCLCTKQ